MVVIGVDLFAAVVGIIGFFSHLIRKGLELITMTRDALKMALDNSTIKQNLQRLQNLATAYRDMALSQLGKDAIDDCVRTCRDTYDTIEDKLLKIQRSTTVFSKGLRAMWQSNNLKELMSKMELSNSKLRDVLIMSHLQAGLDNAISKEVQQTEKTFSRAESRSGYSSYQHYGSSIEPPRMIRAPCYQSPYTSRVDRIRDLSDEEVSESDADHLWSEPAVQYNEYQGQTYPLQATALEKDFTKYFPRTTAVAHVYDTSDEDTSEDDNYKAIQLQEFVATQPQARLRSMRATQKRTIEETPNYRKVSIEESVEFKFGDEKPRRRSCCGSCVIM